MSEIRRVRLETYLKRNSQQSLADLFGLTQGWVSQIKQKHPEARLVLVDGATKSIEYSVNKVKYVEG